MINVVCIMFSGVSFIKLHENNNHGDAEMLSILALFFHLYLNNSWKIRVNVIGE